MGEELKMTNETRARMLSLMPCASTGTYEWTPDCFMEKVGDEYVVPENLWPVLTLRAMTVAERTALRRLLISKGNFDKTKPEQLLDTTDAMYESIRKVIVGWRGVKDYISDSEFPYEQDPSGGVLKDKWALMTESTKADLFAHVCKVSGLLRVSAEDRLEGAKRGF